MLCPGAEGVEQALVGAGKPGLPGVCQKFIEERGAAGGVEVSGRFVYQDQ
jgi:hypothetical protein